MALFLIDHGLDPPKAVNCVFWCPVHIWHTVLAFCEYSEFDPQQLTEMKWTEQVEIGGNTATFQMHRTVNKAL